VGCIKRVREDKRVSETATNMTEGRPATSMGRIGEAAF
jgi:hypothetical protein